MHAENRNRKWPNRQRSAAGATSDAFARWLHQHAPVELEVDRSSTSASAETVIYIFAYSVDLYVELPLAVAYRFVRDTFKANARATHHIMPRSHRSN